MVILGKIIALTITVDHKSYRHPKLDLVPFCRAFSAYIPVFSALPFALRKDKALRVFFGLSGFLFVHTR